MPDLVVPYDPEWPERFQEEAERLRGLLGAVVLQIEHIGSTAVPGIAAKPTIDIAVGVRALEDVGDDEIAAMESDGYIYRGEAGVPGRRYSGRVLCIRGTSTSRSSSGRDRSGATTCFCATTFAPTPTKRPRM